MLPLAGDFESVEDVRAFRTALRGWYRTHRRDLPWRRSRDPYAIWISEVMLQQTTVATVAPRWERFLRSFPTLERLAGASEEEVMAAWSGLGYYSRARNLHAAARAIARGGRFPSTSASLQKLPGFGPYTAAAVASIAFGERVAAVDTNVERLLSRYLGVVGSEGRRSRLRRAAAALVPPARAGDHNQAMMELGATVCRPARPSCGECPLAPGCSARRAADPARFDLPRGSRRPRQVTLEAGLARRRGRLVLVPDLEMVRGHLTLPCTAVEEAGQPGAALGRRWPELAGRTARRVRSLGRISHSVLDRRYTVHLFAVEEGDRSAARPLVTLVRPERVPTLARGSFLDKALSLSAEEEQGTEKRARSATGKGSTSPSGAAAAPAPGPPPPGAAPRRPTG